VKKKSRRRFPLLPPLMTNTNLNNSFITLYANNLTISGREEEAKEKEKKS